MFSFGPHESSPTHHARADGFSETATAPKIRNVDSQRANEARESDEGRESEGDEAKRQDQRKKRETVRGRETRKKQNDTERGKD